MFKAFPQPYLPGYTAPEGAMPVPIPVQIFEPVQTSSHVVFASPHSGRVYPPEFLIRADVSGHVLRSSEDAYVDLLLADAPAFGAPLITSEVPRAYVDFNRDETELDPALIEGAPRGGLNPRVASGLGVIARVVANGRHIYRGKLSMAEAQRRIERYWRPYHMALQGVMQRQHARFGQVLLADIHSMPHEALSGYSLRGQPRPQVVLGDRHGAACNPEMLDRVEDIFRQAGLVVSRNTPFAGAYIAQRYGRPSRGMHVIQIEIDRRLYLDEKRVEPSSDFHAFRVVMRDIVAGIAAIGRPGGAAKIAAE
ncbi:MAG: N-formylglutamate deformylase [Rhodobacteraceae bacterium HLUCCA12]|nr:MAG: N-formylglutamate deformylase [Rhodobacteraceae bacterium HLUCCA12]